ncbi:MAG TPA: hypothetical protein VLR49_06880, partial [Ferruginibacter sp.]|nr:hypothetical protein [Ferruginibacter sp.]
PTEGGKKFVGDYLGYHNGVVFIEILKFGGAFDQSPDSYMVGLDIETGKNYLKIKQMPNIGFTHPACLSSTVEKLTSMENILMWMLIL